MSQVLGRVCKGVARQGPDSMGEQWPTVAASVTGGSSGRRRYGCSSSASRVLLRGVNRMGDVMGGGATLAQRLASAADRGVST